MLEDCFVPWAAEGRVNRGPPGCLTPPFRPPDRFNFAMRFCSGLDLHLVSANCTDQVDDYLEVTQKLSDIRPSPKYDSNNLFETKLESSERCYIVRWAKGLGKTLTSLLDVVTGRI